MTTSNRDKLAAIQMGDVVQFTWMDGDRRERRSGVVNGWHSDKWGRPNLQVDDGRGYKETAVLLTSVVSRKRVAGADAGVLEWHHEQEHATIGA